MTILVVSTVHRADDPRIREKLIPTLAGLGPVAYATRPPPPERTDDLDWIPLGGGRIRRNLRAARLCLHRGVRVVSLHDPELIPAGLLARAMRGTPVLFDLHEDLPAQILTKDRWPAWSRPPLAAAAGWVLRLAERHLVVTLAEEGYRRRFRRGPAVLPNYPVPGSLPEPAPDGGYLVYVGDVTEARGALVAVRAVAGMRDPAPLRLVGRVLPESLGSRLTEEAARLGVELELTGLLPHRRAMEAVAGARAALSPLLDVPNYRDSLPTKVVEYLAMGVPVVAADLPGTARVVRGLPGVRLVRAGDTEAWTEALEEVWGDPALRRAARENLPAVRERFVWPAERVRQIYREAMGAG